MVDFAFDYQTEKTALYDCVQVLGSLGSQKIYGQGFFEPKIIINNVPVSTNIVQMGKDKKTLKNIIHYLKTQINQELLLVEITKVNIDMQ